MTDICLQGCRAEPLSSYLTALAVLRLVSEQKDPNARGWWKKGVFHLDSILDKEGLVEFFCNEYVPTPIVSPWNGGSGFFEGDNRDGLNRINESNDPRFAQYKMVIHQVQTLPEVPNTSEMTIRILLNELKREAEKTKGEGKKKRYMEKIEDVQKKRTSVEKYLDETDYMDIPLSELESRNDKKTKRSPVENEKWNSINSFIKSVGLVRTEYIKIKRDEEKNKIISACRNRLDERSLEWIDAAIIIDPDGDPVYPPILGTGGNEGRLDYSNGFMRAVAKLLPDYDTSKKLLSNAFFDSLTDELKTLNVGQHDPGRSGGFNQGAHIETKDFPVNPWRYILTLEGSIPWSSSVVRRQKSMGGNTLRSPFTVRSTQVGYTSSTETDSGNARAEIWAPLWNHPTSFLEIRSIFSEGRADVGRSPASRGIEFAEAVTSLGVDRGISDFIRYIFLKRRGDSYVALPVGSFPVQYRSESDLVRELTPLLRRIKTDGPASLLSARRNVEEALYSLLQHGGRDNVQKLIVAIGRLERIITRSGFREKPFTLNPISGLSPRWILDADDGSVELRIATALASIRGTGSVGPIRANIAPLDPSVFRKWKKGRGQYAWEGSSLPVRLATVLSRRMMDADRLGTENNPLWGAIQIHPEDVSAFIEGRVDEALIEDLLFGMTWIKWHDNVAISKLRNDLMEKNKWNNPVLKRAIPREYALLKLLFLPNGLEKHGERILIKPEPSIIPLLRANRISEACTIAGRRLRTTGLIPLTTAFQDGDGGLRVAAALLIPMRNEQQIVNLVLKPQEKNT